VHRYSALSPGSVSLLTAWPARSKTPNTVEILCPNSAGSLNRLFLGGRGLSCIGYPPVVVGRGRGGPGGALRQSRSKYTRSATPTMPKSSKKKKEKVADFSVMDFFVTLFEIPLTF